jgi:5'-methylthioadenosine phosphorylase
MAIGIIGGTGVYDADLLKDVKQIKVATPYGRTSDLITVGKLGDKDIVIIPRHGKDHFYSPSAVPYRANIHAMKELGVTKIISVSAVGSLKEEMAPGDFVFTDQFIDRTTKRDQTFFESGKVAHISVAEPFCSNLRKKLIDKAKVMKCRFHEKGTCVIIEGPRFSTKAESMVYRSWNADIINMTMVPEVVLAREAEICYANIAMVTDYDCWKDHTVTNEEVLRTMKSNIEKVRKLLMALIPEIDDKKVCSCNTSLKDAMM